IRRLLLDYPGDKLGEREVLQFASAKRLEDTVAALSLITGVPADLVDRLVNGDRIEPILILCRAVRFKWPTARAVVLVRPARIATTEILTEACDDFNKLTPPSAQHMMRYWQTRQTATG